MLGFSSNIKYYICNRPVDMRNSFDGLAGIARNYMQKDPISGAVFIFLNKNKTHIKLLFWDGDGFALYYKRLEKGRFKSDTVANKTSVEVQRDTLMMLLEGLSMVGMKHSKRYNNRNIY